MSLDHVISAMKERRGRLADDDPRRYFHDTYLRTTIAVSEALGAGVFVDADWVERWDEVFARFYLDALDDHLAARIPPGPWEIALSVGRQPRVPPLRMVLLGMNAHINFDLPQALVQVITDDEFDDEEVLARRERDHRAIDAILAARVAEEDVALEAVELPGDRTTVDRLLRPLNRRGTQRFLAESRRKVWRNAQVLSLARRHGVYDEEVVRLGDLARARVADLVEPRRVILELARSGFGVALD